MKAPLAVSDKAMNSSELFLKSSFMRTLISSGKFIDSNRSLLQHFSWRTLCCLIKTTGVESGEPHVWHGVLVTHGMQKAQLWEPRRGDPWERLAKGQRSGSRRRENLILNLWCTTSWPDLQCVPRWEHDFLSDFNFRCSCFVEIYNPTITGWTCAASYCIGSSSVVNALVPKLTAIKHVINF